MDPQHIRSAGYLLYLHSTSTLEVTLNSGRLDLAEVVRANQSQAAREFERDFRLACENLTGETEPDFWIEGFRLSVQNAPQALIEMMVDALPVYSRKLKEELDD